MAKVLNKRIGHITREAVYVGRPSKWGNPFEIGDNHPIEARPITRDEAVDLYRTYIIAQMSEGIRNPRDLQDKDLVCWCAPKACHADILLELANPLPPSSEETT